MSLVWWGLGLTGLLLAVGWAAWGGGALVAIGAFGLLATGIQLVAAALLRPALGAPFSVLIQRWGIGMGLRLGGIVVFAAAVALDREVFPPLASALGYLGVLIPLLFLETRLLR